MKNNDFLTQFREHPGREFSTELYQRINKPMPKQTAFNMTYVRRAALAFGALAIILFATLLASTSVRAFVGEQVRQFGAIFLTTEESGAIEVLPQPTIAAPPEITAEFVKTPAEAAELAGFDVLAPAYLPEGYSENKPWSVDNRDGSVYVVSAYASRDGRHFLLMNQTQFAGDARFDQQIGDNETVTDVMIGESAGVFLTGRQMAHPELAIQTQSDEPVMVSTSWLIWETNGITYSLFGDGLTQVQLIEIAQSLTS